MKEDNVDELLARLEANEPLEFNLGSRTYKIRRIGQWTQRKINRELWQLKSNKMETEDDVLDSDDDRKIVARAVAITILRTKWRIRLFLWYLWRRLDAKYNQKDFEPIISKIIENSDMAFFSRNLASLHIAAMMEAKMTKETITNIAAKPNSEQETTS